jgi:hypothetical protein
MTDAAILQEREQCAARANEHFIEAARLTLEAIETIGLELLTIQETFPARAGKDSGFGKYIDEHCPRIGQRQARKYIRAHKSIVEVGSTIFEGWTLDAIAKYKPAQTQPTPEPSPEYITRLRADIARELRPIIRAELIDELRAAGVDVSPLEEIA